MARKVTVDKWKTKKWFDVVAPALFQEKVIGNTFSVDERKIMGRIVKITLAELMGRPNFKKQRVKLIFRVNEVKGEQARTEFVGHKLAQEFVRSLVRRNTSKIYINHRVVTRDSKNLCVKAFAVTNSKINRTRRAAVRKLLANLLTKKASQESFNTYIDNLLSNNIAIEAKKDLSKIYPIRHVVIEKTEVLKETKAKKTALQEKPVEVKVEDLAPQEKEILEEKKEKAVEEKKEEPEPKEEEKPAEEPKSESKEKSSE